MFTFLTIEKLEYYNHVDLAKKSNTGKHLQCFLLRLFIIDHKDNFFTFRTLPKINQPHTESVSSNYSEV